MSALKNNILKLKSFFKYFLIGYAALDVLTIVSYLVYMIIYNVKYKNEYGAGYSIYSASNFVTYIISSLVGLAFLVLLIYLVIKDKQKEAKFLFTGWFIYNLFTRFYNSLDGINTMIWGSVLSGLFSLFTTLSLLFAMGAIMLEVFNGNKKLSDLSPLFFIIALGLSLISMIISFASLIANAGGSYVFQFYQLFSMFMEPLFIVIMALVAYIYVTPQDSNSSASDNEEEKEETEEATE